MGSDPINFCLEKFNGVRPHYEILKMTVDESRLASVRAPVLSYLRYMPERADYEHRDLRAPQQSYLIIQKDLSWL